MRAVTVALSGPQAKIPREMSTPTTTFAAREAAIRQHYYQPTSSFLSAPVPVVATVIAAVTPNTYEVQPPFPHSGLDPHPPANVVATATGVVMVLVVIVVLAWKVLVQVIRL
jgi:hypothetical protein